MPVVANSGDVSLPAPHQRVNAMPGHLCSDSKHEPNLKDAHSVHAGIHLLLDRKDWHKHPGWEEAIAKEAGGILENGTWNYDEVISREDLLKRKSPVHIRRLMTILSVKHWETPKLRRLKARIVSRGDDIRDQDNNIAVLQEAKVNPSGLAGINANLAYGCMKGNCATQSDVVLAYTQSVLNTQVPTWVELPIELVPKEFRGIKRPCGLASVFGNHSTAIRKPDTTGIKGSNRS